MTEEARDDDFGYMRSVGASATGTHHDSEGEVLIKFLLKIFFRRAMFTDQNMNSKMKKKSRESFLYYYFIFIFIFSLTGMTLLLL